MAAEADDHAELAAQLAERDAQLAERDARIAELEEKLAVALAAIERLTEQKNQNSSNLHSPPSSDGPGATARGVGRPKKSESKRKQGGQRVERERTASCCPRSAVTRSSICSPRPARDVRVLSCNNKTPTLVATRASTCYPPDRA